MARGQVTTGKRHSPNSRRSNILLISMAAILAYFLFPIAWLVIASTKSTDDLFSTFGLWIGNSFSLWSNIAQTFTYDDGVYGRWLLNTAFYSVTSALAATAIATVAGYGFAKYRFAGKEAMFLVVIGAIMVPSTALAIPTYLLFSKVGLVNTPWAIILPSIVSPFGLLLMRVYASEAIPDTMLEAARIDRAGEFRILAQIALPSLGPGMVTVLLFTLVATWNNYFLPLIMLNDPKLYPITVGLAAWSSQAVGGSGSNPELLSSVITGSLISIIPLIAAFVLLQRFWQSGLTAGAVKE